MGNETSIYGNSKGRYVVDVALHKEIFSFLEIAIKFTLNLFFVKTSKAMELELGH
jgi:hypothetical protein